LAEAPINVPLPVDSQHASIAVSQTPNEYTSPALHTNLIISLEIVPTGIILFHAHPQECILQLCKVSSVMEELCLQDSWTYEQKDIWTDRQGDSFLPPKSNASK